jgi:hypothetical protein
MKTFKKKETSFERLGRFLQESKNADMLFNAMIGAAHSDIVHVDIVPLNKNWKDKFTEELKNLHEEIYDWFQNDSENLYKMLYALERIKRKFRIDFDNDEPVMQDKSASPFLQ